MVLPTLDAVHYSPLLRYSKGSRTLIGGSGKLVVIGGILVGLVYLHEIPYQVAAKLLE
jgi:hypothetical protein